MLLVRKLITMTVLWATFVCTTNHCFSSNFFFLYFLSSLHRLLFFKFCQTFKSVADSQRLLIVICFKMVISTLFGKAPTSQIKHSIIYKAINPPKFFQSTRDKLDILAQFNRPKSTLIYTHVRVHCNISFVLHSYLIKM